MTTTLPLDPHNAERLSKILGLLGSDHDGEVLAAARKANEFLRSLRLTWRDVIAMPAPDWRHIAQSRTGASFNTSRIRFYFKRRNEQMRAI